MLLSKPHFWGSKIPGGMQQLHDSLPISPNVEYVIILEEGLEAFNFLADDKLPGIAVLFNMVNA